MTVDTNNLIFASSFSGFSNYKQVTGSVSVPGQTLSASQVIGPFSITIPLDNTNAVSEVQLEYSGLDEFWRLLPGSIAVDYPNADLPNYQILSFSFYSGGFLNVDTYISDQAGGSVIPNITINCNAFLYLAPF